MNDDRLLLHVANDVAELSRVAQAVDRFCIEQAVPGAVAFKVNVALEELLMNTISYGFTDSLPHEILLTVWTEGGAVIIEIIDDGQAFDPLQAPAPDLDVPLEERRIGGLGIHFVKSMVDSVEYRRIGDRNQIILRKDFASDSGDAPDR